MCGEPCGKDAPHCSQAQPPDGKGRGTVRGVRVMQCACATTLGYCDCASAVSARRRTAAAADASEDVGSHSLSLVPLGGASAACCSFRVDPVCATCCVIAPTLRRTSGPSVGVNLQSIARQDVYSAERCHRSAPQASAHPCPNPAMPPTSRRLAGTVAADLSHCSEVGLSELTTFSRRKSLAAQSALPTGPG
jgi:hypothetical protein